MASISGWVTYDRESNMVNFHGEEQWYEINDIDTFSNNFYQAIGDFPAEDSDADDSIVEQYAYACALSKELDKK